MERPYNRKAVWSWAFYDWANSAYATVVLAGFFPIFFKSYWSAGVDDNIATSWLALANSVASLVIVILAPLLGTLADKGGLKKRLLGSFAYMGALMTALLFLVDKGQWQIAALLYVMATIGFSGANVFYDALIVAVADERRIDHISALGFGLGYLGGGVLFAACVAATLNPTWFGLAEGAAGKVAAVQWSFVAVALWWILFSVPVLLWVKEPVGQATSGPVLRATWQQLKATVAEVRKARVVMLFLAAYFLYIDGVDTIIRMAVSYGTSLGFPAESLITALLITQFVGFPAAIAFGKLGDKIGAKNGILIAITVYIGITIWGYFLNAEQEFYAMAITIGLVQGGIQSLSRSFYTRLIPHSKTGEFFGFYNMLGKSAAVAGPLLMAGVGLVTENQRYAILSILVLFIAGAALLLLVNEERGRQQAQALDKQ